MIGIVFFRLPRWKGAVAYMKIYKILNNNAVLSRSEDNSEVIVTGKGIAFQKKTGDEIIFNRLHDYILKEGE